MTQLTAKEIRDAAEDAETRAQKAVAEKQYDKAADYFDFAANKYLSWADNVEDEGQKTFISKRTEKLVKLAKQCRNVLKRSEMEKFCTDLDSNPAMKRDPDEAETVVPGMPPRPRFAKPGERKPLPRKDLKKVTQHLKEEPAEKPESKDNPADEWATDPTEFDAAWMYNHGSDDTLNELPEDFVPPVAPLKPRRKNNGKVDVKLSPADFPPLTQANRYGLRIGKRFTQHIVDAMISGDLSQIALKFARLADNLLRHAHNADIGEEIELRFTALVCREVADRLRVPLQSDPIPELEAARKSFHRGDAGGSARGYRRAAMKLLKGDPDASAGTLSLNESKAGEYLNLSACLRQIAPDIEQEFEPVPDDEEE